MIIETEDVVEAVAKAIWNAPQDPCFGTPPDTYALKMTMSWDEAKRAARAALSATPIERLREENARHKLTQLADAMERELLPQCPLRSADLYGKNASNNAWHYTQQDEAKRSAITLCADWLRARAALTPSAEPDQVP